MRIARFTRAPNRVDVEWLRLLAFTLSVLFVLGLIAYLYSAVLTPIIASAFIGYLLIPLLKRVEQVSVLPRSLVLLLVMMGIFSIVAAIGVFGLPRIIRQLRGLTSLVPETLATMLNVWIPQLQKRIIDSGLVKAEMFDRLGQPDDIFSEVISQTNVAITSVWETAPGLVGGLINIVLIPILTFVILHDHRKIADFLKSLVPTDLKGPLGQLTTKLDLTLRAVLRGQLLVAMSLMVLYSIGLSFIGLYGAVAIGCVAGLCRVIPYLDVVVGGILSLLVITSDFQNWMQLVSVGMVFLIVQAIDGVFITPRIIGEKVGIPPIVVLISILAFGSLVGFWGVLLSIPIVALTRVIVKESIPLLFASKLFKRGYFINPSWRGEKNLKYRSDFRSYRLRRINRLK